MARNEVCALCGSSVVYESIDVTWPGSASSSFMFIPAHCSNHHCPNASIRHLPLVWTVRDRSTGPSTDRATTKTFSTPQHQSQREL